MQSILMMDIRSKLRPIIRFIRFHSPFGYYCRSGACYTKTGEIALCCIAKLENRYIRDFVEYYKALLFDYIIIYDNNDVDGERFEDVIGDYIASGFVELVDFRGRKFAQLEAYSDCYAKNSHKFDWIAFFDCDEYLTFTNKSTNIHTFLSQEKFLPFQVMHVNWMVFGDNELLDDDGRRITERFTNPVLPFDFIIGKRPENDHVKSIIRGGMPPFIWCTPHTILNDYLRCCTPEAKKTDLQSPFQNFVFDTAYLRHYCTKTIGEWVKNKMKRGIPDRQESSWKEVLVVETFFKINNLTPEKLAYVERIKKGNENDTDLRR